MGGTLSGSASEVVYPIEHYFKNRTDYKFVDSVGSTRFLKVARAECPEGYVIVKIFVTRNELVTERSLPMTEHCQCLETIRYKLTDAINCLPFQKIELNDTKNTGILVREYVKYNLYDRINTRPFLTNIEKKWITFQILYGLNQSHKVGVRHGDIKLENIMVTSWNWVLITDFASIKPAFVPVDNPADYTFFFDTSRRRICYIAPERFKNIPIWDSDDSKEEKKVEFNYDELKPSMDIFSAGCAILEFWNEGRSPFEYSQLLAYKNDSYEPHEFLNKIEDLNLRAMIESMIQRDPEKRETAEAYLSQEKGKLFPTYFYTFLQPYLLDYSASPILSPDEKIAKLKKDLPSIVSFFSTNNECKTPEDGDANKSDGLVIMISLVTSCLRGLHDCISKLKLIDVLLELSKHTNDETILERILPSTIYFVHDPNPKIKVAALNAITTFMGYVKRVPNSDVNIFPDYIFPELNDLVSDKSERVRAAFAQNLAKLAETARRFLDQTQTDVYHQNEDVKKINYEAELKVLHNTVKTYVGNLLSGPSSLVKQTLILSDISKLCIFFGQQLTNDHLLSYMVTFLNDKDDRELREAFFDCIVSVSSYLGWHSILYLNALFTQGLTDSCEFIITKVINSLNSLSELGMLPKYLMIDMIRECAPYLVHPNLWIRQAVAGFITTVTHKLSVLDTNCKVIPLIRRYQQYELMEIEKSEVLMASLVEPIPRTVYDQVIKHQNIQNLFEILNQRKRARELAEHGTFPNVDALLEMQNSTKNLVKRLEEYGMTPEVELHLLSMRGKLEKINKYRYHTETTETDGRLEISTAKTPIKTHVHNLNLNNSEARTHHHKTAYNTLTSSDSSRQTDGSATSQNKQCSRSSSPTQDLLTSLLSNTPPNIYSVHERSYIQYRTSSCYAELRKVLARQQDKYLAAKRNRDWDNQKVWETPIPPPGWKLKGSLVAHLHEHKDAVTKLATIPRTTMFASSSMDGFVRIWDCAKCEGKNIANRSRQSFRISSEYGVNGLAFCNDRSFVAASCLDGTITILSVDSNSSRMAVSDVRKVPADRDEKALEIQYLSSGPQSVLVYTSLYGSIVGLDLRSPAEAWRLENGMRRGILTSFCLDPLNNWVTVGTSTGYHITWDLRFNLPISTIEHPNAAKVRKLVPHPKYNSMVLSSVHGNNEISVWNLANGTREKVIWSSNKPPLSKTEVADEGIYAMYSGLIDHTQFLLTGGTDQRIRYVDLDNCANSKIAVYGAQDPMMGCTAHYSERLIDGMSVVLEATASVTDEKKTSKSSDEAPRAGPEPPPAGHRNIISDIILSKATQCFMVTSSMDGVIKVWK